MSNQQPPAGYGQPAPGQAPPPGYYQQQPPKKKHTVRNVLLIIIGIFVLFMAGCFALVGGVATEMDKALDDEAKNDKPREVSEGKAFTHDGYEVDAGWKVATDFGTVTINNLRVTAAEGDPDFEGGRTAMLTFRFYDGTENLAEVTCSGKELQVGESSSMDCFSGDKMPKGYKTIKVADAF